MKKPLFIIFLILVPVFLSAQFTFIDDPEKGMLTIKEGEHNILTYCYGDQLKEGLDPKYTRSCYIHPLYSLDGKILTQDFPLDHLHHSGIFWTWPVVKTRGQETQTWHVHLSSLRQYFKRWMKRENEGDNFILSVENVWKLSKKEIVVNEKLTLIIHPADGPGRAIDLELILEAIGGPLELKGTSEGNKGYGGLCLRGSPLLTGASMTTNSGQLQEDTTNDRFLWADLSTDTLGISIFVSPDHPDFPTTWLIRNSYAGILNPSWPGLELCVIHPGKPVCLRYCIYVHQGNVNSGQVSYS
ncbi:MAG: PmoA family protein [Candidatus Aminicenantes bacterium]|nr:PmoA family protein [Candidatus Aminicenantes bacterium]